MKEQNWRIAPTQGIGELVFGMSRREVQKILGKELRTIKKSLGSKNKIGAYSDFHVYYDESESLEAIEIFNGVNVILDGVVLYPGTITNAKRQIADLKYKIGSYISKKQAIGLYAPETDAIESILIGCKAYYG